MYIHVMCVSHVCTLLLPEELITPFTVTHISVMFTWSTRKLPCCNMQWRSWQLSNTLSMTWIVRANWLPGFGVWPAWPGYRVCNDMVACMLLTKVCVSWTASRCGQAGSALANSLRCLTFFAFVWICSQCWSHQPCKQRAACFLRMTQSFALNAYMSMPVNEVPKAVVPYQRVV